MAEMLMQSQDSNIHLLPTLPSAWKIGKIKGLVASGGFVVDIKWGKNKLVSACIKSNNGNICIVLSPQPFSVHALKPHSQHTNGKMSWFLRQTKTKIMKSQ